jgi:quercetin dioxygenase-like cupin family protein
MFREVMTTIDGVIKPRRTPEPLRLLLESANSSGELGVVEMQMPPRAGGPPLHVHPTHGEGFYVLEGQLAFQIGTEVVTAGPGTWLFAPRNVPHTLANPGDQLGTLLCFFAPGGFERRFARALAQQAGGPLPPDLETLSEAERATKAIGPPLQF